MSIFTRAKQSKNDQTIDPFTDPVAYLASLGIEAELVETTATLPEAA
jgi:hypothetical protein